VKANNSYARTLIFGFFFYYIFIKFFRPFLFLWLSVLLSFLFFLILFFIAHYFSFFFTLVLSIFFAHVVLSLADTNLVRNKRIDCCMCTVYAQRAYVYIIRSLISLHGIIFTYLTSRWVREYDASDRSWLTRSKKILDHNIRSLPLLLYHLSFIIRRISLFSAPRRCCLLQPALHRKLGPCLPRAPRSPP
jgi:hypothetical protein